MKKLTGMKAFSRVTFVLGVGALSAASAFAASDGDAKLRHIAVSGACSRSVVPDRASIMVTAEVKEADPKRAMQKATEIYEKVRERVLKLKIDNRELSTSEVSLNEQKVWENNKLVSKGFVARMGLRVESSDAASLGDVSRVATEQGMRDIGSLSSYLSSAKTRAETEACLKDAVKAAQRKAQEMADAAGAKLGEVISLSEGGGNYPSPPVMPMARAMMMDAAESKMATPTIEPGKQEIQVSVNAVFGIK